MASTKISALTTDSAPHRTNDFAPTYDASAVATKKVALRDFGSIVLMAALSNVSPADATTYYFGSHYASGLQTTDGNRRIYIPRAGIITTGYIISSCTGTLGSGESNSFYIRKNAATDTLLTSTFTTTAGINATGFSCSISVAVGDLIEIKWVPPTWATNPTGLYITIEIFLE